MEQVCALYALLLWSSGCRGCRSRRRCTVLVVMCICVCQFVSVCLCLNHATVDMHGKKADDFGAILKAEEDVLNHFT